MTKDQPLESSVQTHVLVFVYGTLKRGHEFNYALANQTFICETTTTSDYRMYNLGTYPGLIEVDLGSGAQVQGEVYRVDQNCLQALDQIEAVDQGLYERRKIRLLLPETPKPLARSESPVDQSTLAYFYLGDISGCDDCSECW